MFLLSTCSSSYWDKNQGSLGIRWYHWNHECNLHTELEKRRKNSIIQNSSSAGRISVLLNVKAKPNPSKSNNIHRSNIMVNFTIAALLLQLSACHLLQILSSALLTLTAGQWPAPLEVWLTLQGFVVTQGVA